MTAASPPHIILSGGGTGGHLFPGLATAECLHRLRPDVQITVAGAGPEWLGGRVREAGYRYLSLPCRPMPRRPRELFRFAVSNLAAYYAASRFLAGHPAAAVVGLGGYASVPMARAALARRRPLVLLEQNAVPGKATRFLARRADAVCLTFDQSRASLPAFSAIHLTGNPVRRAFTLPTARPGPPQMLVLGGSGGAQALNQCVPEVLGRLRSALQGWRIVHQAGAQDVEPTTNRYAATGLRAKVVPWLDDMPLAMGCSSLAISRAGGTTLAELAAAGLPAVLVPYPYAAADHQQANAHVFWAAGAAEIVQQRGGAVDFDRALRDALAHLLLQPGRIEEMRTAIQAQSRPEAADTVARIVLDLAKARFPHSAVQSRSMSGVSMSACECKCSVEPGVVTTL